MRRSLIVDVSVRVIFRAVLVGSVYLLFAGHNQPGGGFVGGLVAGVAIALRFVAGGIDEVRQLGRVRAWTILAIGLLISSTTAIVPVALGEAVMTSGYVSVEVPVLGSVSLSSALPFDIGVYLVVVGLVLMVFEAFGGDEAEPAR